jgi:hypothetical protein
MKHKQWNSTIGSVKQIAPLLILTLISACTSPLWWHDPNRGFIYRGWSVNVADQATVMRECVAATTMLGCVIPSTMTAFSVNNSYVLAHECHHIEAIMNNEGTSGERAKDIILTLLGLNDLMTVATILFPAPNNCGDGTMAEWTGGKFSVTQADYGKMQVLPTIDEWNRLHPEKPMLR